MSAGSANLLEIIVRAVATGVDQALNSAERAVGKLADGVEKASKRADPAMKALGKAIEGAVKAAEKASEQGLANLGKAIEAAAKAADKAAAGGLANLGKAIEAAAKAGEKAAAEGLAEFDAAVAAAGTQTVVSTGKMEAAGESLRSKFESSLGSVIGMLERLAFVAGGALVAGFGAAAKTTNDFVTKLADIKTLGVAEEDLNRYHDALIGIADTTSVSLIDLTAGLYDTIKSGVRDAATATELLNIAQKASVAIGGDVKTNVDLLSTALATFGSNATTSAEKTEFLRTAADKLNAIVDNGKFAVDDFASFLGKVAPIAADAGLSLDQVGASLTTLAAAGLQPKQAFSAFEALLEKLINPTTKTAEAAKKLGFEIGEDAIKGKDFRDVLESLIASTGGTVTGLDAVLGDMSAVKAALVLTGGDLAKFDDGLAAVGNSAGSLDADFKVMEETVGARLGRLRNVVLDRLLPAIETELLPRVGDALGEITDFFERNGAEIARVVGSIVEGVFSFIRVLVDNKDTIIAIVGAIFAKKVLDTFLGGIAAVAGGLGQLGSAFATLGGAAASMATEGVGAITGLLGAIGTVGTGFLALIPIVVFVASKIVEAIGSATDYARKALEEVRADAAKIHDEVAKSTGRTLDIIKDLASDSAEAAAFEAEARIAANTEALTKIEADRARSADRVATIEKALAASTVDSAKDALAKELALESAKVKAAEDNKLDLERANDVINEELFKANHEAALKSVADVEAGEGKKVDAKTRSLAKIKALLHEESDEEKKLAKEKEERDKARLKAELEAVGQLSSGAGPQVLPIEVEVSTEGPQRAFESFAGQAGADVGEALQDGSQKGMERGLKSSRVAAAIAKVSEVLGAGLGKAAKFFGDQILGGAQAVGDFFLNLFVTGPISEFMNLLKLAASTPAQATVNAETGAVDVQGFADVLDETLNGFIDTITQFVQNLPTLLRALIPFIGELVNTFVAAVPQIVAAFADNIGPIIQSIITSIGQLADTFTQNVDHFIGLLMDAVQNLLPGLVDALMGLILSSLNSDVANNLFTLVLNVIQQLIDGIIGMLPNIVTFIMDTAGSMAAGVVDFVLKLIKSVLDAIPDILDAFVEGLPGFITDLVGGIIGSLIDNLPGIVISLVDLMIFQLPRIVVELIRAIVIAVVDLVKMVGQKIADAFREGIHAEDIGKLIGRAILAAITFGISEVVRHDRRQRHHENSQAASYDQAVHNWEQEAAGQDSAWVADHPPPDPADYAHTGGVIGPTMGDRVQRFRFGGVVRAVQSAFTRRAADEVPIMAQPGEAVLNRAATAALGASAVHDLNAGGAGGPSTIVIQQLNVDPYRTLDSQVHKLFEKGAGRTGAWDRRSRGPQVRRPTRFGLA